MNDGDAGLSGMAAELAAAFDRGFVQPRRAEAAPRHEYVAIQAAGAPYAIRLTELSELRARIVVTPVPGAGPDLCGIASFRGLVAPVYDLRSLLGYPSGTALCGWCAMVAGAPVALAFDEFEGHLRLPAEMVAALVRTESTRRHIRHVLDLPDGVRPIIDMSSIIDAIGRSAQQGAQ